MNDPIKDFVEQHREEFDHLEAPVLKLDQLKAKIHHVPEQQKRSFLIININKMLVAASILMALTCAWFFLYNSKTEPAPVQIARQNNDRVADPAVNSGSKSRVQTPEAKDVVLKGASKRHLSDKGYAHLKKNKVNQPRPESPKVNMPVGDIYARLKDSTSASSRLLAILELEKADQIDNHVMDMLATTLNHDGNTNVRLAALSLLEKFSRDGHVSALLITSLDKQNDPIVQLGLVSALGKMKNIEIDDKLESLAYSPNTFAAVRDEAYSILLKKNKL
jgi:hypothetical protein